MAGTNGHVTLGIVPIRGAVRIRLRCTAYSLNANIPTCQMSNLRFANQVPNWSRYGVFQESLPLIEEPSQRWDFQVARDAQGSRIPSRTDPFLSIKSNILDRNGTSSFQYRSPLIALPQTTGVFTASVDYAQDIPPPVQNYASQTEIKFVPLTGFAESLLTIPITSTSTLTWTKVTNVGTRNIVTKNIAGKIGWIQISKAVGLTDHVLALDNITIYLDGKPIRFPPDQLLGKCRCDEGSHPQHIVGDPVNTATGSYYLQATHLTAPSGGPPLTFERSYTSFFADPARYPTTPLGPGWRHPFAESLVTSSTNGLNVSDSAANTIIYEAATGNRLRFYIDSQGVPHAAPGVRATLDKRVDPHYQQPIYVLRSSEQWLKIFDLNGRLLERRDPTGRRQTFSYYTSGQIEYGQLEQVTDLTSGHALRFTYIDRNGPRLSAVAQVPNATTSSRRS